MTGDPKITIAMARARYGVFSWQGQAPQYDQMGPAGGVVHHRYYDGTWPDLRVADTLLFYGDRGHLTGILNYYPQDCYERDGTLLEKAGNVNLFVRPDIDHDHLAPVMIAEARTRWPDIQGETPVALTIGNHTTRGPLDTFDGQHRIAKLTRPTERKQP
jgi:hypothetical protein